MAYHANILTSIHGRRLGLQTMTTGQTGGRLPAEFLVGPEQLRMGVTTAESTGVTIPAYGVSVLPGTSAGSSSVYTLEPPIPGVRKEVAFASSANGNVYMKTANSETIQTTFGSSFTVVKSTGTGWFELIGLTTAIWMSWITSGTTSNAGGFALTTTT